MSHICYIQYLALTLAALMCMSNPTSAFAQDDFSRTVFSDRDGHLEFDVKKFPNDGRTTIQRLTWLSSGGVPELIYKVEAGEQEVFDPVDVYRDGNNFALLVGGALGTLEYKLYARDSDGVWKLKAQSPFGAFPSDSIGGKFTSLFEYHLKRSDQPDWHIKVTDMLLFPRNKGAEIHKLSLLNGKPFHPRSLIWDGAVWDQSLDSIQSAHDAQQQKKVSANESMPAANQGELNAVSNSQNKFNDVYEIILAETSWIKGVAIILVIAGGCACWRYFMSR